MIVIGDVTVHHGNCLDVLATMGDCTVDSVVTDPPYELGFMGKDWDNSGIAYRVDLWREVLRVLKPGGHLLAFGGTRTYHRMAVAIEDAGFEIRDSIHWVYGCLDESTLAATPDGDKHYRELTTGSLVLCYDVDTGAYSYQPVVEVVEYEYSDIAYRLVGDHGEQVVTRNHRCIVERGRGEAFEYAETLQSEARVPVLESLRELRQALPHEQPHTGATEPTVRSRVHKRAGETVATKDAPSGAQGPVRGVRRLWHRGLETGRMVAASIAAHLQPSVQWQGASGGVGQAFAQGSRWMDGSVVRVMSAEDDRREQSGMEGRPDVPQTQGRVRRSIHQVCALSRAAVGYGAQGRVRHGASPHHGAGARTGAHEDRVRSPREPRRDGQPVGEPDAVRDERRPQEVRAWAGHRSTVVRVVPFHYTGKVWCLRVPTGAFVAVRNGMAFPTGNSGFPKSLDVSKAIDKQRDDLAQIYEVTAWVRSARDAAGIGNRDIDDAFGFAGMAGHWTSSKSQPAVPTLDQVPTLLEVLGVEADDVPEDIRRLLWDLNGRKGQPGENWAKREVIGTALVNGEKGIAGGMANGIASLRHLDINMKRQVDITAAATDAAKQWEGWGTALKPAHEPIVVARRPLIGTVAANVLAYGTGALNIDEARIGGDGGRWPANVIFDPDAAAELDRQEDGASRFFYVAKPSKAERNAGLEGLPERIGAGKGNGLARRCATCDASVIGGCECPDRTYVNPASTNPHPTVKPLQLMRYLIRLVTPPGGTVLEPFAGSGTTLMAATIEGFTSIGIELTDDYLPIIEGRVRWAQQQQQELW